MAEGDWRAKFVEIDTNQDGVVSLEEFQAAGKDADKFARIDMVMV